MFESLLLVASLVLGGPGDLVEPARGEAGQQRLARLADRCGDEVDWAVDWGAAAGRARASGRPVLVVVWLLKGFTIANTPRTTTFMDADLIKLANSRFEPLWVSETKGLDLKRSDGTPYSMGPGTFGQALLVVAADGRVLAETHASSEPEVAYGFLRRVLERESESYPAGPLDADLNELQAATALVDTGQLEVAWRRLVRQTGLGPARQRARILKLTRQAPEALAELTIALSLPSADAHEAGLAKLERVELLLGAWRFKQAREEAQELVELVSAEQPELLARALVDVARATLVMGEQAAGRALLQRVTTSFESTRSAPLAAFLLSPGAVDLGLYVRDTASSQAALTELLYLAKPAVLPANEAARAAEDALAWLLAAQTSSGSFPVPSDFSHVDGLGANPYADATTALAGRALIAAHAAGLGPGERVLTAAQHTVEYVIASLESREEQPPLVFYMDYMTWSNAAMLDLLADAAVAELLPRAELEAAAKTLMIDLAERRQDNGGWSYYKKTDLAADDVPAQSISFTTAGVSLALSHAAAVGFEVPHKLRSGATRALRALRDESGVFAYFLYGQGGESHPKIRDPRGDVGRGPACELALYRAAASDLERLEDSVELFLDQAPLFTAQRGKALMHAGLQGQGCHYLYFDYLHAALASQLLPKDERRRRRILDLVLDGRGSDGSFQDTPITGRAYGTAMALRALIVLNPPD